MSTADATEEGITVRQRLLVFVAVLVVVFVAVIAIAFLI